MPQINLVLSVSESGTEPATEELSVKIPCADQEEFTSVCENIFGMHLDKLIASAGLKYYNQFMLSIPTLADKPPPEPQPDPVDDAN